MDYLTKPTSRHDLRKYSKIFRKLFRVPLTGPFPVLEVLDRLNEIPPGSRYEILEDSEFPPKTMARCFPNEDGGFTIEIRESVYNGAYERQVGAYLDFINHEICHVFLYNIGFTPILERSFGNYELPAYRSVEWQAKALCGEVMVPYEESQGMALDEIVNKYHVSKGLAKNRLQL